MSLMGTYRELAALDQADAEDAEVEVKEAEAVQEAIEETVKMAQDYDAAGRRLAHVLYKQAAGFPGEEEDETERQEMRAGRENKPDGKSPSEKEDEEKDKEKKRKKEGDGEEQEAFEEKKASILAALQENPEYREAAFKWINGNQ